MNYNNHTHQLFYNTISSNPGSDWGDVLEDFREFTTTLNDRELLLETENLIAKVRELSRLKYEREVLQDSDFFCLCCHEFVLSCEVVQAQESYLNPKAIELMLKEALTQDGNEKRSFLIHEILYQYKKYTANLIHFLEMWLMVENAGIRLNIFFKSDVVHTLFENDNFLILMKILEYRCDEHDSLILKLSQTAYTQKKFELAYELSRYGSTHFFIIKSGFTAVLTQRSMGEDEYRFLNRFIFFN